MYALEASVSGPQLIISMPALIAWFMTSFPQKPNALAYSSYNPDSGFAMNLADNGGAILVPVALELIKSDESFDRWDALSLLGRLYEKRTTHRLPAATVQTIKQTIVNATTHREITTRRWAVRVLGQIGTLDDVALLQRIAATDGDTGPRFSVREEAVKAIETIRQRK